MPLSKFLTCFQFQLEDNIKKLDYSNNMLTDGFPHVWQFERTLEELNVTSTRINYLPPQLFYCQGLKVLLANNNSLENIPEALGSLRNLQQLNLSRNFISNVPDNIKCCKNLIHLDLSCNSLQKLPDALTCLISLQELILNETFLEFLPANFGRLVNLRIVELRTNSLVSLPKSMQRLTNLHRLDIGCNEFTIMPEVIGELKQLRELWIDFNQIQILPLQLGKLRELEHFEANGNCLSYLPNEMGNWLQVEVLSISMNNLSALPFNVGVLQSLVTLKCESNELKELPECISNLKNLEEIVLSHNKLSYLPSTLGMLRKLRYLFADDNNLASLPDEICSCSLLSVVSVSQNKLCALPDNIGHLTNLRVLNIVQNSIATLPVSILSLVNLTSLWINNNQSQPLIPLQYIVVSQKTYLTCVMLPQVGIKQKYDARNKCDDNELKNDAQSELANKEFACSVSKRRICFAEETAILHKDQTTPQLSKFTFAEHKYLISDNISESEASITNSRSAEMTGENNNSKDYLMRSPTPYPKELRLMAKHFQLDHQKSSNSRTNDMHGDHKFNSNYNKKILDTLDEGKLRGEDRLHSKCGVKYANLESCLQQNIKNNPEIEAHVKPKNNSIEQIHISQNSASPPPYHIARCFTKKSVEDLTRYEFTRKQQEQRHFQNWNPYINHQTDVDVHDYETSNMNINFEYKNNFTQHHSEQSNSKKCIMTAETANKIPENKSLNMPHTMEPLKNLEKKKCSISRTKWLFGAHKNPRVMQVNVNWESGQDFEVDILPNKEGIFVTSTVAESNASQLVHPLDKVLEVDGIDFTNININEARQILQNSRPSISIMFSRK